MGKAIEWKLNGFIGEYEEFVLETFLFMGKAIEWKHFPTDIPLTSMGSFLFMGKAIEWKLLTVAVVVSLVALYAWGGSWLRNLGTLGVLTLYWFAVFQPKS